MTGNERIRNTLQQPSLKIHIGAANFRKFNVKQSRVLFKFGSGNFA
jgi:hypothetical protein